MHPGKKRKKDVFFLTVASFPNDFNENLVSVLIEFLLFWQLDLNATPRFLSFPLKAAVSSCFHHNFEVTDLLHSV